MSQKVDQTDLIRAVQELALNLNQTPTRGQFESSTRAGRQNIDRLFGGRYSLLLQAAGLETYDDRRAGKKIDNSIFHRNIEHTLAQVSVPPPPQEGPQPTFAVISDIHWPFENPTVLERFYQYVGDVRPDWVILNGDAWDMYSHSKFPRSHNLFTPREEQAAARSRNEAFWKKIQKMSPKSQCQQMMGNHDVRPMKRVLEAYPEAEDWIAEKLKELFTYPGVTTELDPRQEFLLGDAMIFHGYRSKLGDHRDYTLYNTVNGHTHLGGVVYRRIRGQTLWELNSGLAGNPEAKGLTYTPQKITHWTPGFGARDIRGPRFISC